MINPSNLPDGDPVKPAYTGRLDRTDFSPGIVPQDAIYGSLCGISLSKGSTQTLTTGTSTLISFSDILIQRGNITFDNATDVVTIGETGLYWVAAQASFNANGGTAGNYSELWVETDARGGTFAGGIGAMPRPCNTVAPLTSNVSNEARMNCSSIYAWEKGQQFRVGAHVNTTGTIVVDFGLYIGYPLSWFSIWKLSDFGKRLYTDIATLAP